MIELVDWNTITYSQAYEQQKELFEKAIQNKKNQIPVENKFIFCEHLPVITMGKNGRFSNLLFSEKQLQEKGIELYQVNRGGDITYHGPGQIVGYPILDLEVFRLGLKDYIFQLEEGIIQALALYGIKGERLRNATGVWLDIDQANKTRKIAAIGVRSSRYITMHGFALNVNTDLSYFNFINPCGFVDKGVTSMEKELDATIEIKQVKEQLATIYQEIFQKKCTSL
jgi:lipoyl(octanoyl) transferase